MRHAPQTSLNATNDHRDILVGLARPLAINSNGTVRPLARNIARRVGIIIAPLLVSGVVIDHRIHIAGGDAKKQVWFAQRPEGVDAAPIRLRDDAYPKPLPLEYTPDDRHTKAGVINVGVTGNDDDVTTIPAELIHLSTGHREPRCRPKALRPILAV